MRPVSAGDEVYRETLARLLERGHVAGLVSRFYFDKEGPLQSLIHQLKYNGMTSLGVALGERLAGVLMPELDDNSYILLPVPLHRTKKRERGYNQSEYICKGIANVSGLVVAPSLLKRTRYTQSQTALDIEERRENVADAFALNPRCSVPVADQSFVLVDDVITTGATIDACARLLVKHGAKRVLACSVALAP